MQPKSPKDEKDQFIRFVFSTRDYNFGSFVHLHLRGNHDELYVVKMSCKEIYQF